MTVAEGYVGIDILQEKENTFERFETAFSSTVENYINSTPINVVSLDIKKHENKIDIEYEFTNLNFNYKWKKGEATSIEHSAEFGRALFEFWAKCLIETFFKDELQVKTKHINLSFFNIRSMNNKTI